MELRTNEKTENFTAKSLSFAEASCIFPKHNSGFKGQKDVN